MFFCDYTKRKISRTQVNYNSEYKQLISALVKIMTPSDLIRNKRGKPFNIGRAIQLDGFKESEI
ncbi:MAG: hypothetical protein AAFQ91_32940 [Cyanobacteria bacterium J06621_15]